jgi:hypothetical protein
MRTPLERAAHWRQRAEEYRTVADNMKGDAAKATYLRMAESYEALAAHAEAAKTPGELKRPW